MLEYESDYESAQAQIACADACYAAYGVVLAWLATCRSITGGYGEFGLMRLNR